MTRPASGRPAGELRPAALCRELLGALEASEGRRRRRQRDTTPDAIGLAIKRDLLEGAIRDDPDAGAFEAWLLARALAAAGGPSTGAVRSMALEILAEWRLADVSPEFRAWLEQGTPSADAEGTR